MFTHILGTTLVDFPGIVASTVFSSGCNLRCPFCHNPDLVLEPLIEKQPQLSGDDVVKFIQKRSGFISGVAFTGGEPLMNPELESVIDEVKKFNLLVKLDTNGMFPRLLERLIDKVDYVAMDIKSSPELYSLATGGRGEFSKVLKSLEILMSRGVKFEVRTTAVPTIWNFKVIDQLCETLDVVPLWVIQNFVPGNIIDDSWNSVEPYNSDELDKLASYSSKLATQVRVRKYY
ncbi:MAG: anaerobic ribonucleoside-triphosphate reductase activating protein [Deltaproteobacteria bacterium]|nr:anaerobic ribonucleoside-triphosphate reductase activating protein [Deltaproteobacteria bacterium]